MRRNAKSITTSPDIVRHIDGLTEANFDLLTKLVPWLAANEKQQRRFREVVIGQLTRLEAAVSLLLVDQQAHAQFEKPFYFQDKLEEDMRNVEEFISKQSLDRGLSLTKYIYEVHSEVPATGSRRGRRTKWTGWEI